MSKQVLIHVMPIGIWVRRKEADVLVQVESAAQGKIEFLLLMHADEVTIDSLHRVACSQAKDQVGIGPQFMGDHSGNEGRRRVFIWLDDDFHAC